MTASDGQCLKRMPRRRSRRFEETIQSIAGLRAEHHANATQHRRVLDRVARSIVQHKTRVIDIDLRKAATQPCLFERTMEDIRPYPAIAE